MRENRCGLRPSLRIGLALSWAGPLEGRAGIIVPLLHLLLLLYCSIRSKRINKTYLVGSGVCTLRRIASRTVFCSQTSPNIFRACSAASLLSVICMIVRSVALPP
mgnify:CR=1 FL=1